jgi:hypothetical protein
MPDNRSLEQKLYAVMAAGSGASGGERTNAAAALERLQGNRASRESPGLLTRERILASEPDSSGPTRAVRVRFFRRGTWYIFDEYDVDWDDVKKYHDWEWVR